MVKTHSCAHGHRSDEIWASSAITWRGHVGSRGVTWGHVGLRGVTWGRAPARCATTRDHVGSCGITW
eukprot:6015993-Prymnesium_polylepis.1